MIILAEFTLPDGEHLQAFNDWYSGQHVADFLGAPGITSGRRFYSRQGDQYRFVAIYEHDGSCSPRETFASPAGQHAVADFDERWRSTVGAPTVTAFRDIGTGDGYLGWPPPDPR